MYLIVFISLVVIVAALVFGAAMFSIVKSIRRGNSSIAAVSPEVARKHLPLICLISVPQILLIVAFMALFAAIVLGFLLSINPFQRHSAYGEAFSIGMWIITLLVVSAVIAISIERHRKSEARFLRDFLRVNTNSISNFSFFFAAFASHDFYELWPFRLAGSVPREHSPFLDRELLWIFVFFGLWRLVNSLLLHILEMRRKEPPENLAPPFPSHGQVN